MLELFPEGFEERDADPGVELAAYTDAAGEARARAAFDDLTAVDVARGLGGSLARVSPWRPGRAPLGRPAVGAAAGGRTGSRHRARSRVRNRRPSDDAALPRAARRAAARLAARRRVRLRRARHCGGEARIRAGHALDHDPVAVETTTANAAANGVEIDVRVRRAVRRAAGRGHDCREPDARGRSPARARIGSSYLVTSGYLARDQLQLPGRTGARRATRDGWAADVWALLRGVTFRPMATFSVGFLGCKVSHVDAHAVRERLLSDGHSERTRGAADVAVVSTCCVTHEAVSKSRKAVSRPGAHARPRLCHRLRGKSYRERVRWAPGGVVVVAEVERGDAFPRSPAMWARSRWSRRKLGSIASAPSSRCRTAAASRAHSA